MALAAQKGTPVAKLVLNEAGPVVAHASLERIAAYFGKAPPLPSFQAAEQLIRAVSAPFGLHTDEEWRFLTEVVVRKNPDGSYRLHYDPKIADALRQQITGKDLESWPTWDAVRCPTLVIRGALSDLLSLKTVAEMRARRKQLDVLEVPDQGHAPLLIEPEVIAHIAAFINSCDKPR